MHVHPGQRRIRTQLADQARGVERRPAGQLGAFEEQHVRLAPPGEVEGDARPAHPATDDHDPGTVRYIAHTQTLVRPPIDPTIGLYFSRAATPSLASVQTAYG